MKGYEDMCRCSPAAPSNEWLGILARSALVALGGIWLAGTRFGQLETPSIHARRRTEHRCCPCNPTSADKTLPRYLKSSLLGFRDNTANRVALRVLIHKMGVADKAIALT